MNEAIIAFNLAILKYGYRIMPTSSLKHYGWDVQDKNDDGWKTFLQYISSDDKEYPQKSLYMVFGYILACVKADIQRDFAQFVADKLYEDVRNRD